LGSPAPAPPAKEFHRKYVNVHRVGGAGSLEIPRVVKIFRAKTYVLTPKNASEKKDTEKGCGPSRSRRAAGRRGERFLIPECFVNLCASEAGFIRKGA
jgi:hypothetical protein